MIIDSLWRFLSYDIGIDLGTANTFVYLSGKGIVVREPSMVAREKKGKKILAVGKTAKKMVGKTPEEIEAVKPLEGGVVADFDAAEAMLAFHIKTVHKEYGSFYKLPRPRVVVGIPSGVTEVERRAVQDAALAAGARKAILVEEPMAAALGADLPIEDPEGQFLIDIGGGTTEIAVISLGGIVVERCLRVAGDEFDKAIVNFLRLKHGLYIGLPTAEEIKISIGSAVPFKKKKQFVVRGRSMEKGLPQSVKATSVEVREALGPVIQQIVRAVSEVLEETPPELVADILKNGIVMAGGGSLLYGIDKVIAETTKMPVWVADDPLTCVVRGTAKVLEDEKLLEKVRVVGGLK